VWSCRQAGRQAGRQTDRQAHHRQTQRQAHRVELQTGRQAGRQIDRHTTDRHGDGHTVWSCRQLDRQVHSRYKTLHIYDDNFDSTILQILILIL